jgi:hypothetical protein
LWKSEQGKLFPPPSRTRPTLFPSKKESEEYRRANQTVMTSYLPRLNADSVAAALPFVAQGKHAAPRQGSGFAALASAALGEYYGSAISAKASFPEGDSAMRSLPLGKSLPLRRTLPPKSVSTLASRRWQFAKRFAIVAVCFAGSPLAMAQSDSALPSVDRVLERFWQGLGGRAALESVTSMTFTGALNVAGLQEPGKTTEYFKYPDHFAFVAELPGYGTIRTVYDGKTAWNANPQTGVSEISGPELSDIRRRADIHWNLKLKEFYPALKVTGSEKVNGKDAWTLEAIVDSWTYRFYFDASSGLLVRFDTDTRTPESHTSVLIGDYRDVGRVRFAFTASMTGSRGGWSRTLDKVAFNVPIDDAVFAKPAGAADSTPGGKPHG